MIKNLIVKPPLRLKTLSIFDDLQLAQWTKFLIREA